MVEAGRTAVPDQLSHGAFGAQLHRLRCKSCPDIIESRQPWKELEVLHLGKIAREILVIVMMGIHQPRIYEEAPAIDDPRGLPLEFSYAEDPSILDRDIRIAVDAVGFIAADDRSSTSYEQISLFHIHDDNATARICKYQAFALIARDQRSALEHSSDAPQTMAMLWHSRNSIPISSISFHLN